MFSKEARLNDSVSLKFGTSGDLQMYHDGSNSYMRQLTSGNLYIDQLVDDSDILFRCDDGSGGLANYFKVDGSDERNLFSKKVRIDHDVSDASTSSIALDIDMDVSGSDALSSDVAQYGIKTQLNSTATGGDTSDEHRLIAIYGQSAVNGSSDADTLTGVYGLAVSNRDSSATSSLLRGVQGIAYVTDSAAATSTDVRGGDFQAYVNTDGPDVTTMYGVISNAYTNTNSTDNVTNTYGLYGKAESRGSGTITNANGVYGEIEVDAGTITNGNCFRAVLDHNGGTLTTGYMFRGSATGTIGTTIGVYVDGEDRNYFSNRVGIGASSPTNLLHVKAADGVMVDTYTALIQNQEATAGDNFGLSVQAGTNSSDVSFRVMDKDGNEYFRVRGDGNVGIGTTSPSEKLEVDGDIKLSGDIELGHASDTTIARSAAGKATIEGREITTNGSSGTNYISWSTNGFVETPVQDELHIGNSLYGNYHFNWQTVSVPRTSGTITKNEVNCGWLIPVDLAKVEVYVNVRVNAASQNIVTRAFKTASNLTSSTSVTYLGSEATVTGITQASFQDVGPITDIGSVSKGEMLYVGVACTNGTPQMRFNITVFGYIA